ncbi:hypothetical protein OG799_08960 [Micromonospora sp. NBC_00898]|uniref:hypothetical protein n=1 Tax=Micromonospora sp. NBC_00898 TaxID=2975981 RepID=UPI00386C8073|nr:hypothetical protein OG799_08960 [Micromonospora sp. NBC_00898]
MGGSTGGRISVTVAMAPGRRTGHIPMVPAPPRRRERRGRRGREAVRQRWWVGSSREYGACAKAALDVLSGRHPVHFGRRETDIDDALRDG